MAQASASESLPVRTQFLLFTLLGDFVIHNGGKIWTVSIIELMSLLDISERAVRSALSRMSRKGWITAKKHGRRSQYVITPKGHTLLKSGDARIFEPVFSDWDGLWHIVVYSLPERKRRKRHTLRKQLTWLGFGRLAPGTWISPHGRHAELNSLLRELDIQAYVEIFSGKHYGPSAAEDLIHRCWDIKELEAQYQNFVSRYQPLYEKHRKQLENGHCRCPTPHECFIQRFWLTHEFQSMPLKDPNLPTALLPPDWIGFTGRNLVLKYRKLLEPCAFEYVREVMNRDGSPNS